mmetsp:Transcript_31034/g.35665  ORF Transcript_31034/g.35665 Transcript_31034/m.35665 type:complete len:562 (-) Transcript_31034:80-1765(-)
MQTAEEVKVKVDKEKKRMKKDKKKQKKEKKEKSLNPTSSTQQKPDEITAAPNKDDIDIVGGRIVSYSATVVNNISSEVQDDSRGCTLLLFYQYIEPMLDENSVQDLFNHVQSTGDKYTITGRARVACEGLNCTLTGSYDNIRNWCKSLRSYCNEKHFSETEFKLTDHLPPGQAFPRLHVFRVEEIVNYGLAGKRAPSIHMSGVHLEPSEYHKKMTEDHTVIIDVRNHYEAQIGKFTPPENGAKYIDPLMRKSTEFPIWLDKPETKEMLKGKQVLMYCTGGVRCERASALLRTKIETEEDTKALGIKGVFQLQGGIDKYFRDFPDGGWWRGKNYVFDKRFSHAPPVLENKERLKQDVDENEVLGNCEACHKPWDKYRGKRRCPTCGVPSLICRDCYDADKNKIRKLDRSIRCELCVNEGITSKRQLREREDEAMEQYEKKLRQQFGFETSSKQQSHKKPVIKTRSAPNPESITRLFIKNMSVKQVDQEQLCELVPGVTHIEWITDRKTQQWYGAVNVEVASPEDASRAVGSLNKQKIYGRVLHCAYSKPDPKSIWPPPNSKI